jgi:predicted nucleic acid-binding protein
MSFENPNFSNESHRAMKGDLRREQIHEGKFAPEVVERIEKSKIEIDDKINLMLTKGGLKPASEILLVIKTWHDEGLTEHMSEEDVQESLSVIQALELPYRLGERKTIEVPYSTEDEPDRQKFFRREQMNILIGRTPEDLEFLELALKSNSDEMLGKAFGYPPTAIEAFVGKRETLDRQSLPPDVQRSDGILFSSPTLSRDNWQKEAELGQLYGGFIRKISPKLYEEMRSKALENIANPENRTASN